ncbi:MAG: FAD-dependent oxidoreductase, partial [Acidimicrobiaceae bacterium]|nr:FAD-dependent oxidoreductase [Acidimicrobiaceae bacterium]
MATLPDRCEVVVVGGGVIGVSVAYHLAEAGIQDVVLLERKELTSGTTWHAAGLVGQLRTSINMTKLARYTSELYRGLEAETGQATGYRQCGSISIAATAERFEELKRSASMAKVFGLEVNVLSVPEIAERYPLIQTDDLFGGIHIPSDGYANAVDITQALAKGAKQRGARLFTHTKVEAVLQEGGRVTGVRTAQGEISAKYVVICGGMWSRDLASSVGVNLPLHACEHYYVLFESVDGLSPDLPVLRDYDACTYYKYDAGKLLLGAFEPNAKPWGMGGISEDFCFDEIAGDFDHFEPVLHDAMKRLPALERAGIQKFFCGPESFTPDVRYHLGETPELKNCYVAAGLNSIGLQSAGGVGKVTAEWIRDGKPPVDLWEVDVRRNMPFQRNRQYLQSRVSESLGLLYATHFPFRQYETGRGVRKSVIHDRLVAAGACHGEAFGWERPNWYAPAGVEPVYEYSYGRQNWFEHSAAEHRAVREGVALFDQSSFAKFRLEGRDAARVLSPVCANDIDVVPGRVVYTQWLNEHGGIEADLTVTRLGEDVFMIVSAAETEVRDFYWLKRHIPDDAHCVLTNVTSSMGVISIMGPRSRDLLQSITPDDLSHAGFPFATSREIEMGFCYVRASRITFVGELGWELYIPTEFMQDIYDRIVAAGAERGLVHAGYH